MPQHEYFKSEAETLRIYDLLRKAHDHVKQIWREFPELAESGTWDESAVDAVDNTLYLAEGHFARFD